MVGNTYDVVVLSSSPPAVSPQRDPPSRRVAIPASSPLSFSPAASPRKTTAGASTTNPRAAPIPEGAVRGFATVGSLVRSEHFTSLLDDDFAEIQEAQSHRETAGVGEPTGTVEKPKKRTVKKATAATDESEKLKPKPKPRARKANPKSDKEILDSEDELRRPQRPTKSPFFDEKASETTTKPPDETANAPKLTKSGKPRKPRAKKQKSEEEDVEPAAKPKRVKITKPKTTTVKGGNKQSNDAPVVSAHFQQEADKDESLTNTMGQRSVQTQDVPVNQFTSIWEVPESPQGEKIAASKKRQSPLVVEELELEEAVVRRRDWTPPHDTTVPSPFTDSTGKENRSLAQNSEGTFTNLLSNFAYAQSPSGAASARAASSNVEVMAATKRRRVELVEIPGNQTNSRDSSPEKGKAPKKKPRTITDLVTGQYGPRDEESDSNTTKNNFFEARTSTTTAVPLNDTPLPDTNAPPMDKPPRKRRGAKAQAAEAEEVEPKSKAKSRSKKASAKSAAKPKPIAEKLLSPTAAILRLNQQDVLFGTSSQLALEESPSMIRQIQIALKESEQDADNIDSYSLAAPSNWPRLSKVQGQKGLWAASARDDEGGMLEHTRDVYIPEPDRTKDIPLLMDSTHSKPDDDHNAPIEPSFIDIDDIPPDPPPAITVSSDLPTPPRATPQVSHILKLNDDNHQMKDQELQDIDSFEQEPPPSNQNAASQHKFFDIDEFDLPPSAQLQHSPVTKLRPPASALEPGDASPKKRSRPPKQHYSIHKVSKSSTPVLKPSSSKSRVKTKENNVAPATPPGSSLRFIDIEEILDSEDDALEALSPTTPRIHKHADSGPLPLISLSPTTSPSKTRTASPTKTKGDPLADAKEMPVHCIPTKLLEWVNIKPDIFAQITTHIRSLSPTTDPANPTWHEKILMYDPIVLEDFTSYLNASTSIRVFKKATQKQIKAWNQQRKVDGEPALAVDKGEDGKSDGEEVLAVEKELEAYMIQGWCESLSVCCIWGEGRGKSGVRKGFY